ncbi:MAG: phospholipid/cholesterol/gamma-HCH transport system permease protein [Rhodospirillaceae bacterium]|jgi:phospholipid/cholesterol/gamma-HCH transport system permease protein|nr:phospholipid/cholesterol/gamma-HCH transport system permease protein [Rhodospirillaceae bacterium]
MAAEDGAGGMTRQAGSVEVRSTDSDLVIAARGPWTVQWMAALDQRMAAIKPGAARRARFDLSGLDALDSAGAWLIARTRGQLAAAGLEVSIEGVHPAHQSLLDRVLAVGLPPKPVPQGHHYLIEIVAGIGSGLIDALRQGRDLLGFFGAVVIGFLRLFVQPRRLRPIALIAHIEQTGLNALPIVGLISFLIGIVIAYQGADQLRQFGAQVFTVNLVGVSVLREMGILLTSIIVAGRTGSAFTAQIGTMQVNEEVDALRTLGLDPLDVLVLPRVLALMIALPLLTFYADITALLGGGVAAVLLLDMTPGQFLTQLHNAVTMTQFLVGLSKAPVFALLIAMVGCFEGLRVTGSAESVGRLTTQAVVESLFLVIVFDALFSILFSYLHI